MFITSLPTLESLKAHSSNPNTQIKLLPLTCWFPLLLPVTPCHLPRQRRNHFANSAVRLICSLLWSWTTSCIFFYRSKRDLSPMPRCSESSPSICIWLPSRRRKASVGHCGSTPRRPSSPCQELRSHYHRTNSVNAVRLESSRTNCVDGIALRIPVSLAHH